MESERGERLGFRIQRGVARAVGGSTNAQYSRYVQFSWSLATLSTARSERLTKPCFRCRVHRNDRADTHDILHVAVGENGRYQREAIGELHFLDQLLSCGSAAGSAVVLLCVASQVW